MATGWAGDGAVQDQIDATVDDAIARARRQAVPGVRLCVACQQAHDDEEQAHAGYNRRASKDSQLR